MSSTKVVILNWNGANHLRQYLPSVIENSPIDVGIVVADNGSTDSSIELLEKEFKSVEIIRLDRNYGFAEGYNRAMRQIESDYAILLNSDVRTPAGWVEPLVATLDQNPDIAAVAPKLLSEREPSKFEYAGAAGGYIDFLATHSVVAESSTIRRATRGNTTMRAMSFGQAVLHSAVA